MKTTKELDLTVQEFKKLIRQIEEQGFSVFKKIISTLNGSNYAKPIHVKFIDIKE